MFGSVWNVWFHKHQLPQKRENLQKKFYIKFSIALAVHKNFLYRTHKTEYEKNFSWFSLCCLLVNVVLFLVFRSVCRQYQLKCMGHLPKLCVGNSHETHSSSEHEKRDESWPITCCFSVFFFHFPFLFFFVLFSFRN